MMRIRLVFMLAAAIGAASADTITLRDGKLVEGSYLGGTARQIRMAVGDEIRTFDIGEVLSIRFEHAPGIAPATKPVVAEPAAERRVLKPEPVAPAMAPAQSAGSELPSGTNITIRMIDDVDSQVAAIGQTFRASVDEPVMIDGRVLVPRGADVATKLVELKEPGKLAGGGQLTLDLASIAVNGKTVDVETSGVTMAGESRKGESAKVIGGTAALGAIIGAIAGGGKGAAIGAVAGGGAGTAVQVLTQGTRVRVPSETRLTFSLQRPVRIQ
jgi:hypothetical protein